MPQAQTTYQRMAPEGEEWSKKMVVGTMEKNPTRLTIERYLLARACSLYWERRPDPRNCQTLTVALPA